MTFASLLTASAAAQNLVVNPSFEVHSGVPTTIGQLTLATGWVSPTGASPDYFLAGAPALVNVPANSFGNQAARTGVAYAGFHGRPVNLYREYVQAPLVAPLVAGQTYQVSFHLSLIDQSRWAIDRFGAYLSVGPVGPLTSSYVLGVVPQIAHPAGVYITDKVNWTPVSGTYVAAGGEDHIVVGNFDDNVATTPQMGLGGAFNFAYYFVDDVSVVGVDPPCVTPPLGMVSWWPLDEASGAASVMDIADGNHGTPQPGAVGQGGPAPTAGTVGGALSFNGTTDMVEVSNAPNLNVGIADLSIDAWIQVPAPGSVLMPIVEKAIPGPTDVPYGYSFFLLDGFLGFWMRNDVGASPHAEIGTIDATTFIADGLWHHVVVSVERTPASAVGGQLFVDGLAIATFSTLPFAGLTADNPGGLTIGSTGLRRAPRQYFEGAIDEVEIFNEALTVADVLSLYTAGGSGKCRPTPGPTPSATPPATATSTRPFPTATATSTAPIGTVHTPTATFTRILPTATATRTPSLTPRPSNTPTPTCAEPISIDISTGGQPVGSPDANWSLVAAPAGTLGFGGPGPAMVIAANGSWTVLPSTDWIAANQNCAISITPDCPGGTYSYELCWEQCGALVPSPLQILADNTATVRLDATAITTTPPVIDLFTPATIPGFALGTGVHRLRVDVYNNPFSGGGGTATGLDLSGTLNGSIRLVGCPPEMCAGDCGRDGAVTIDDLVTLVNIALSDEGVDDCTAGDTDASGRVSIDELVAAVNAALAGCA